MAKQISTEEEFNLKRQTRRRLIGAVALVLFVVIFLPIVFDSEPAPSTGNDIELRIPDKDSAPEFQPKIDLPEIDKMDSAAASAVAASAPVAASEPVVEPAPAVAASPVESKPAAEIKPVETKPKAEPKPKTESKPKAEAKPAAKAQAVPKSGFVLQVGAFSNADTAKSLQAKLNKLGYHAYTEKAGNVVRVRVGSYPTREAAEKARRKLEAQGSHANVVNLN
ncbi:MAG TPA: SPOR domain-containing protein [Sideroxyarcus sp.]|nr:SPOR domain-containing protein [Sideroxyarcus sp.]